MTLADTPDLSEKWCPLCAPDRDPSREILEVKYCYAHVPVRTGVDDGVITETNISSQSGTGESEGETNRLMSDLLKKGKQ